MIAVEQMMSGGLPSTDAEFDEFVYLLSHDVRASVRAMRELPGWIQEDLLESGVDIPANVTQYFGILDTHTKRLDQMLLDLLTYSRVGRMQNVAEVEVAQAVDGAVSQIKGIDRFQVVTELGPRFIRTGERDLTTLLRALVSNAVKHNPNEQGTIHIQLDTSARNVCLTVEDDGPGIPENDRARVLEPMVTLKSRDEVEGSGMGLAIARKIASTNMGSLTIDGAQSGSGTKVTAQFHQPLQS